ncbi:MAG: UDP-N-acetyl-D-glucosamine dehydrogenase, partial [Tissierellia bacterium]|nr:UDP-N-acetyl-D-glucosamine dehydrogenase [Tissierellia bacterium]
LSRKFQKALSGSKVLVLGVAYKNDIDDLRDSPALLIFDKLEKEDALVDYYDPFNPSFRRQDGETEYSLKEINPEVISEYDIVLITTDHTPVDYQMVVDNAKFVFDTKNATKNVENKKDNIELL